MTATAYALRPRERRTDYALRLLDAMRAEGVPSVVTRHEAARLIARTSKAPARWEGDHSTPVGLAEVARRAAEVPA